MGAVILSEYRSSPVCSASPAYRRISRYRRFLFYVFAVIFLVLLILGLTIFRV
jgi:hypothetical protein